MSDYQKIRDAVLRQRLTFVLEHFALDGGRNLSEREVSRCVPVLVWAATAPVTEKELNEAEAFSPASAVPDPEGTAP